MPSYFANEIIREIVEITGRPLVDLQKLQCEEIIVNVYGGAAKRFIRTWATNLTKKGKRALTFDHFYVPMMNGIVVGGMRRPKGKLYRFDTPNKRMIYAAMHSYLGTNFTMKELEDIVWFTEFATIKEVQTAVGVANHHGVVNGAYVRAIIIGNRRKAAAILRAKDARFKTITEDPPDVLTGVPNVKPLQDAWTKRLKDAAARQTDQDVERGAERKLQI